MTPDQRIREEALGWAARTADPEFAEWEAFTAWLEQDPAHAAAYDALQLALDEAAALLRDTPQASTAAPAAPANDNPPPPLSTHRARWWGGAIAAGLVLALTFLMWPGGGGEVLYRTAPGKTRLIALADGSKVELGGGSRIAIIGKGQRQARLEAGQALFTIRHDARDPFVLDAGAVRLIDAGTVFDVRMRGEGLDLAVAEGAVIVNPAAEAVRVDAGRQAVLARGRLTLSPIAAADVGEWTRGRITLREASLAEVAAELTRSTGIAFAAAEGSDADMRLSGSLALEEVRKDPSILGPMLGLAVRREGAVWIIAASQP